MDKTGEERATPGDTGAKVTERVPPDAAEHDMDAPLVAAKGDDDLMSQPATEDMSLPRADEVDGKWKQQVGAAKIAWARLTEDELLETEGCAQKLVALVQERYDLTYDAADKQVKGFFENYPP